MKLKHFIFTALMLLSVEAVFGQSNKANRLLQAPVRSVSVGAGNHTVIEI